MKSKSLIVAAIAAIAIVAGIAAAITMSSGSLAPTADKASGQRAQQITAKLLSPSIPGAPALGDDGAKVTIVEFGDYQCTWCMRFHEATKEQLMDNFVETG